MSKSSGFVGTINGDPGNEAADKLAVDGISKRKVDKSADTKCIHTRHLANKN